MKHKSLIMLIMASTLLGGCVSVSEPSGDLPAEEKEEESFDPESIRAQDDFNGYVNAAYLCEADLDEYKGSYGSFALINKKVDEELDAIIKEIAEGDRASYEAGSNEQLIYDAYYQLLDASTGGSFMNEEDVADMLAMVDEIQNAASMDEYIDICGKLYTQWGADPIMGVDISTDLKDASSASISIRPFSDPTGHRLKEVCMAGEYGQAVASGFKKVLNDTGMDGEESKQRSVDDARLVIDIATATDIELVELISKDWGESMKLAKYKTKEEIDALCPNIGMDGILRSMGLGQLKAEGIYLWDEGQLSFIDSVLTDEYLKQWKDIAVYDYMCSIGDYLPKEYGGSPVLFSNDKYARDGLKYAFGRELGEEYAKRYYDEKAVEEVKQITDAIVDEYVYMIDDCEWLSDKGKSAIKTKLDNMLYFIGADEPHTVDPKDAALIGHSVFDTKHKLNIRDHKDRAEMLSSRVERNGFNNMAPQAVNACYAPDINSINITLAIMNEPFYSHEQSYWQNLGGIGAVVGHEISHAFDDHGMLFDMNGNYNPEWIPKEDREAFEKMAEHIKEYYSKKKILDVHPVDGELTLGENLADISGVDCILRLTQNNDQRKELFENYARIWASLTPKDSVLEQLYSDEHSPAIIRVNAVVPLFDQFYEIYDVKEGDAMYVAPEDRVTRW